MLGSRLAEPGAGRARAACRCYKYVANRCLTTIENRVLGTRLSELHTGYRAYSRELLLTVPFLRNALDFSFDSEMLIQARTSASGSGRCPARTIYFDDASSIGLRAVHGLRAQDAVGRGPAVLHRSGVWRSRKFEP